MQIKFTPYKIRLSKTYIENLTQDEKHRNRIIKKRLKPSFLKRIWKSLFDYPGIA
jgi:hypothetical protein